MSVPDPDEFKFYDRYDATAYGARARRRPWAGRPVGASVHVHARRRPVLLRTLGPDMRHMLIVGPFPWHAIGVFPGDWRDCEIDESLGEADALRRLRKRAYDVMVTSPATPAARDFAIVIEARDVQPGIRTIDCAGTHARRHHHRAQE